MSINTETIEGDMIRLPYGNTVYRMEFSQIEAQCAALHFTELEKWMYHQAKDRITHTGRDTWTAFASKLFDVPEENVTPAMRQAAKNKAYSGVYS